MPLKSIIPQSCVIRYCFTYINVDDEMMRNLNLSFQYLWDGLYEDQKAKASKGE